MKDFNQPLRKAFYDLLNNQLSYNSAPVKVFDQKVKKSQDSDIYVIIASISSTNSSTFHSWSRDMQATLDIVTKTGDTVSTKIVDNIAGQIFALTMPTVVDNGLNGLNANFQYINLQLQTDRYLDMQLSQTVTIVRRLLTFSLTATQTN